MRRYGFIRVLLVEIVPELPEVETIRRGLDAGMVGRRIVEVIAAPDRLRKPSPCAWTEMAGLAVTAIGRHAKAMRWHFDSGHVASVHLGMTGKFLFCDGDDEVASHTHIRLLFEDGTELRFSDPRRFGWFALHAPGDSPTDTDHYGIDALDAGFTAPMLGALLEHSRAPLKGFLLDQTKVAGLGNIYVCEALWHARLSPRRKACNTPRTKLVPLHEGIIDVLRASLAAGGTSFNDYVNSLGEQGSFLFDVAVFQREGQPCNRCGPDQLIRRIVQAGRSTFFCPGCQR